MAQLPIDPMAEYGPELDGVLNEAQQVAEQIRKLRAARKAHLIALLVDDREDSDEGWPVQGPREWRAA